MQKIITKILFYLSKFFCCFGFAATDTSFYIIKLINYLNNNYKLKIITINYNDSVAKAIFLVFILKNENLYEHSDAIKAIYNTLISSDQFKSFGEKKVIITSALIHNSVVILVIIIIYY